VEREREREKSRHNNGRTDHEVRLCTLPAAHDIKRYTIGKFTGGEGGKVGRERRTQIQSHTSHTLRHTRAHTYPYLYILAHTHTHTHTRNQAHPMKTNPNLASLPAHRTPVQAPLPTCDSFPPLLYGRISSLSFLFFFRG